MKKNKKPGLKKTVHIPLDLFNVNKNNTLVLNEQEVRDIFLVLAANISEWDGTDGKYIMSKSLNTIRDIKINFLNKLAVHIRDKDVNTFDVLGDINTLYLLHKIENDEMSYVMKVRKKRKC